MPQQQILQQRDILYDQISKTFSDLEICKNIAVERVGWLLVPEAFTILSGLRFPVKPVWVWHQGRRERRFNFDDIQSIF